MNPKSQKARNKIADSFLRLLNTKSFESIKITEIMTDAGVSRSVFYTHFKTKEAIFAYILDRIFAFPKTDGVKADYFTGDSIIWDFIELFDEYGQVFLMLQQYNAAALLTRKLISGMKQTLDVFFEDDLILKDHTHYFLMYIISSIVAVTFNWVRNGKKETKQELFEIIKHFRYKLSPPVKGQHPDV